MPRHQAGGKLTKSHTTLIDAAQPVVDWLQKADSVSKISLGMIKVIGRGKPGLKFHLVTGGWRLVIRGNISLQELVIYTSDPERLKQQVEELFGTP